MEKGDFHCNQHTKTLNSGIGNSADTKLLLGPTQSEIAKCFGLSERTIRQAKKIRREAPELNNHIYVGDIKIDDACRLLSEAPAVRCQVLQRFNEDKSLSATCWLAQNRCKAGITSLPCQYMMVKHRPWKTLISL